MPNIQFSVTNRHFSVFVINGGWYWFPPD